MVPAPITAARRGAPHLQPTLDLISLVDALFSNGERFEQHPNVLDFEEPKRVRHFFLAPLISAHHRDAQDLNLRRLDHHRHRLQVTAARARTILIDNDFAARLSERKGGRYQKTRCEKDCSIPHGHLIGQLCKARSDVLLLPRHPVPSFR